MQFMFKKAKLQLMLVKKQYQLDNQVLSTLKSIKMLLQNALDTRDNYQCGGVLKQRKSAHERMESAGTHFSSAALYTSTTTNGFDKLNRCSDVVKFPHSKSDEGVSIPRMSLHMQQPDGYRFRQNVRHFSTETFTSKKLDSYSFQWLVPIVKQTGLLSWPRMCTKQLQHKRSLKTAKVEMVEEEVVTAEEIKKFLSEREMRLEQGFTCFVTRCPCLPQTNKKPAVSLSGKQLYINMTTGHFVCEHCSKRGGWRDLVDNIQVLSSLSAKQRKAFACFKDVSTVQECGRQWKQAVELWEGAMPIKTCAADLVEHIQEYFNIHELHASVLDKFDVRYDVKTNSLVLPAFDGERRLMGVRRVTCTVPEEDGNTMVIQDSLLPKSGVVGLFGLNTMTREVSEIVLTCSELDAMAVYQETKAAALALPTGVSALPQELLPVLERFTSLVLWFGDDVRAWEAAKLFAKKLNDKRCCIIRPSTDDPSPLECLRRRLSLRAVLSKARPVVHKSIVSFAQLRQEIFSQFAHTEQVAGVKWKRYVALNRLLKGHRRGELTVFTGPTGSGKTTFISDYSLDLCMQGVNTLWGSFEINNIRLGKVMLQQFAQCSLSKHLDDFDRWANQFEELPMYFMTFFGQENIKKVIEAMSHAVYVHDIAHVVVDNLQFMMGSNGDWADRFAKQDMFISAFRKFATNMNCHVTLVIHPRKEKDADDLTTSSVFGSAKATQEADNVMILQDKRLSSIRGRKYLQITKNRFDGELGVMLLKFDKDSLSFAVKEKPAPHRASQDFTADSPHLHQQDGCSNEIHVPSKHTDDS